MNIELASRMSKIKPSPTLQVAAKAQELKAQGKDIINLGTGEPDFDTPDYIKKAACDAINSGFTKYTAVDGIAELKQAIKNKFKNDNQLDYDLNQIIVSVGGKQAIYNLCEAILNPGDEVLIPAPYWVSYPDMVMLTGANPVIVPSSYKNHYKITPAELKNKITDKTKLLILNSPSNPSGVAYTLEELKALSEVLREYPNISILTDDIYEHIIWSGKFVNILNAAPDFQDRTIIINGVSKAYAMTGWRIGYAAGPASVIKAMKTIQSQSTSNPCSIAQKAAVAALNGGNDTIKKMVKAFHERHDYLIEALHEIKGVKVIPADGTFYLFPNVDEIIHAKGFKNDLELANALLNDAGIALVPGSAFGCEGSIRLSFATSMETLKDAMQRFRKFVEN